jgi:hypothetical protein
MQSSRKLFAVCSFEVSEGIYLSEMKSVLKRIHRGISERSDDISYSAAPFVHAPKVQCLFQSTAADSASSFYDTKINNKKFSFKLMQFGDECICFRFAFCLHAEVANASVFV